MFSSRARWHTGPNAITRAISERRDRSESLIDLTNSNPTTVGFETPKPLATALARGALTSYQPDPRGSREARSALSRWLDQHGASGADPDELFLTSSTSEAYGWIMKLLCDPGDRVLRFAPTYPLLDHLASLESVKLETSSLERGKGRWNVVDDGSLEAGIDRSKAVIVVNPNNPTGHFLSTGEMEALSEHAASRGSALIADEVFFEYSRHGDRLRVASISSCLTFSLGGLSKSAALPHWKLGWIRITGPEIVRARAIAAMELIADTYLPVSGPVQLALGDILVATDEIREPIRRRIEENLDIIDDAIGSIPSLRRDPVEGGWSAAIRVPLFEDEEQLTLELIDEGVLIHPGFFYDFPNDGWIVVSLLPRPEEMAGGMAIICDYFQRKAKGSGQLGPRA